MLSWQDDRTGFAAVIAAVGLYAALGAQPGVAAPVLIPSLLIVAAGVAFAPDRWRGVNERAAIATACLVVVVTVMGLLGGNAPWFWGRPLGVVGQTLMAVYLVQLMLLSGGYALSRVLGLRTT